MGAFFLFKKNTNLLFDDVAQVFNRKGFSDPDEFELGNWKLWLYRKQLISTPNFHIEEDGYTIFCCGTVIYRGLGYQDTLKRLLTDYRERHLDQDELLGNFILFFWNGKKLTALTDRLNVQHVFFNDNKSCFSSSFLALLMASPYSLPLNHLATYEKLTTGYILSPETLVEGIQQINTRIQESFTEKNLLTFIHHPSVPPSNEFRIESFDDSINRQLELLKQYFTRLDRLHCEFGGELGLSSGYDCRLILALSRQLTRPIGLHTHHTLGVHDEEQLLAEKLSEISGNDIISVSTRRMEEQAEDRLDEILRDSLYFFDGRCANSIGAFSETYTNKYRKQTLGQNRLGLNGLGGEIFRNSYFTPQGKFSWPAWMDRNVFYPFSSEIVGSPAICKRLKNNIHNKIVSLLQSRIPDKSDLHTAHTYYGRIRMPECAGNVNNAYNQVSFFLTPFIEYSIIQEALNAISHIGCNGNYQAWMIRHAAPDLAEVRSHYGFSFSRIPMQYILKSKLKSMIPLPLLNHRKRYDLLHKKSSSDSRKFTDFCAQSKTILEIEVALKDFFSQSDWPKAMLHYAQRRSTIFTGSFFREFSAKIRMTNPAISE